MGSLITFSDASAREIYTRIAPEEPRYEYLSSRLLSRQIKYCMHKLHRELALSVLEELERSLRSRTKDSWGQSFCTLLVVCLCIEGLQTATDTMVVCSLREKGEASEYRRNQSKTACEELDEYPFQLSQKLFHEIYRSHREGRSDKSFNPLRRVSENKSPGVDSVTEKMVRMIFGLVYNKCEYIFDCHALQRLIVIGSEILELSERPVIIDFGNSSEPGDIRINNTGRLAAKFLRSFFPEPESK